MQAGLNPFNPNRGNLSAFSYALSGNFLDLVEFMLEGRGDILAQINDNMRQYPHHKVQLLIGLQYWFKISLKRSPVFLFDEKDGVPHLLKTIPNLDPDLKAVLVSYAPHTRQKEEQVIDKNLQREKKADLFDLQHYVKLDSTKLFRKEDRRLLRKATYDLVLVTLETMTKPNVGNAEEEKGAKQTPSDTKLILGRILDNAITKEKTFSQGKNEFEDILQGLKNNLEQVIDEYQNFFKYCESISAASCEYSC